MAENKEITQKLKLFRVVAGRLVEVPANEALKSHFASNVTSATSSESKKEGPPTNVSMKTEEKKGEFMIQKETPNAQVTSIDKESVSINSSSGTKIRLIRFEKTKTATTDISSTKSPLSKFTEENDSATNKFANAKTMHDTVMVDHNIKSSKSPKKIIVKTLKSPVIKDNRTQLHAKGSSKSSLSFNNLAKDTSPQIANVEIEEGSNIHNTQEEINSKGTELTLNSNSHLNTEMEAPNDQQCTKLEMNEDGLNTNVEEMLQEERNVTIEFYQTQENNAGKDYIYEEEVIFAPGSNDNESRNEITEQIAGESEIMSDGTPENDREKTENEQNQVPIQNTEIVIVHTQSKDADSSLVAVPVAKTAHLAHHLTGTSGKSPVKDTPIIRKRIRALVQGKDSVPLTPVTSDDLAKEDTLQPSRQFLIKPHYETLMDKLQPIDDMEEHVIMDDNNEPGDPVMAKCKYCKQQIIGRHDFRKHIKSHPEIDHKPWKCPLCDYRAGIKSSVRKHINVHSDVKPYMCSECGRGFNFKQKLALHMKYHRDIRDFYCPKCPLAFHELKTLKNHIQKLHFIPNPTEYLHTVQYRQPAPRHKAYKEQQEWMQGRGRAPRKRTGEVYMDYVQPPTEEEQGSTTVISDQDQLLQSVKESHIEPVIEFIQESVPISEEINQSDTLIYENTIPMDQSNVQEYYEATTIEETSQSEVVYLDASVSESIMTSEPEIITTTPSAQSIVIKPDPGSNILEYQSAYETSQGVESIEECEQTNTEQVNEDTNKGNEESPNQTESIEAAEGQAQKSGEADLGSSACFRTILVQTSSGPISVKVFQAKQAATQLMDDVQLVEEAVPSNVQEAADAMHTQDAEIQIQEVTRLPKEIHVLADTTQPTDSPNRGSRMSRLVGTKKIQADTMRYKQSKIARDHTSHKRKRSLDEDGDSLNYYSKMKKVTCMAQVEIGVRPYVAIEQLGEATVQFQCRLCPDPQQKFDIYTKFLNHVFLEHPLIKPFTCSQCDYKCRSKANLISHSKTHTGERKFACTVCGKAFLFRQKLTVHMRMHENLREHTCSLCQRAFNEKADLNRHFRKVHMRERTVTCPECAKKFFDHTDLRRHLQSHSSSKQFKCKFCHKHYQTRVSLTQHMKSHTCIFHCEICNRDFGSYSGFMAHKVMHDESSEGYLCELCDKKIMTKGSMKRHLQICHNDERPFVCRQCNKSYKCKKDLKNHLIVHGDARMYICELCPFTSKRLESLRVHMRRHDAIKPYQCGLCSRQYTQKRALVMHMAVHMTRPNSCIVCLREFPNEAELREHMYTKHCIDDDSTEGGDSLKCAICEEELSDSASLSKHMLSHVPEELRSEVEESGSMTLYKCEECQCACVSQDALAVHILEQHMTSSKPHSRASPGDSMMSDRSLGISEDQREHYNIVSVASAMDDVIIASQDGAHNLGDNSEVECEVITDSPEIEIMSSVNQDSQATPSSNWNQSETVMQLIKNENVEVTTSAYQPVLTNLLKQGPDKGAIMK